MDSYALAQFNNRYLECETQDELIARAYSDIIEVMFLGAPEKVTLINYATIFVCNKRGWELGDFLRTKNT